MTTPLAFETYAQPTSGNEGFVKPMLTGLLFLGISVGLISLYTQNRSGDMVSYKGYKDAKIQPSTSQNTPPKIKTKTTQKTNPEIRIESSDIPNKLEYNIKQAVTGTTPTSVSVSKQALELIQKGMRFSEEGKHNSAELEFEKAATLSPNSPEVHAIWATALRIAKKYKSADHHFDLADKLAPNDDEILFNWGMSKLMGGDVDGAIRLIEKSLSINPNNPIAYNYLGKALGKKKDYDTEITSYKKALKLEPNFGQVHFNIAVALSLKKKFDDAAEHFKRAIQLDPQFNKPFVQRFLTQYDAYKNVQDNNTLTDPKSVTQTTKIEPLNSKKNKSEGSDHYMEGSGKVKKEITRVRGTLKINGKPLFQNAVVFLETKDKLRVHGQETQQLTINQRGLEFEPKHSVVMVGSTITFLNRDTEVHNIYSKSLNNQFNLGAMAAGTRKTITVKDSGPIVLRCNMHKDMLGTIFVVPNGYYTKPDPNGSYEFENVKSKEYFMQVWAPRLDPSEVEANMKSIGLTGKDAIHHFDIKSQSVLGEIHDMVDKTDYIAIVNNMETLIYDAIASWKAGKQYKPRKQMLIAITKHFDGEGLKGAIAKSFSEKRSILLEAKLDTIRKKVSGLVKDDSITESSLKREAALAISQLRLNVQELESRLKPATSIP